MLDGLDEATTGGRDAPGAGREAEAEVFELTDDMAVARHRRLASSRSFQKVEPRTISKFAESAASQRDQSAAGLRAAAASTAHAASTPQQPILSHSTVSAVESAFNSLAHTVLSNNARTLEDLVKEMLRPMLKSWLDDNLPGLVERIVKAEIERVSRGR